jgi:hypothetical protein
MTAPNLANLRTYDPQLGYVPDDQIAREYRLADALRDQPQAKSFAGVLAQGLGAVGGNLVQSSANNALSGNQALRSQSIQDIGSATDLPSLEKAALSSPVPEIQNLGLETKVKQFSDDPTKEYRVRAAQAKLYGLQEGTPEYRNYVLTKKINGDVVELPSNIREWNIFNKMTPEEQQQYLTMKRADKYLDTGTAFVRPNPVNPAQPTSVIPKDVAGEAAAKVTGAETAKGQMGLPKAKIALEQYNAQSQTVTDAIDKAISQANGWTTGLTGSAMSAVPGTQAHNLQNTLNTIKANIGFDKLQAMRENSPTGGALGQVSDMENRLLQSVWGSIEQSQTKEQLVENLNKIKAIRERFTALKEQAYEQDVARFGAANVPNPETGKLPGGKTNKTFNWSPDGGLQEAR